MWPVSGALRVHHDPVKLPAAPPAGEPGLDRFDDPDGQFVVRYVAATLRGCLVETMAGFRPNPRAEALLASITGTDGIPGKSPLVTEGIEEWLDHQQMVTVGIDVTRALLVDVNDPEVLARVDGHPRVRAVLDASDLGTEVSPARLDEGLVRLSGRHGRPISQAVARAVWEWFHDAAGIAYRSRHDDGEQCLALFDRTPVVLGEPRPLDRNDAEHRGAVQSVAHLFGIELPPMWAVR